MISDYKTNSRRGRLQGAVYQAQGAGIRAQGSRSFKGHLFRVILLSLNDLPITDYRPDSYREPITVSLLLLLQFIEGFKFLHINILRQF
jgi:hypothetical protein